MLKKIKNLFPTIDEIKTHKNELCLCLVSGLLMILPWPRFNLWPIAWIGVAPFFYALMKTEGKMSVWCGLVFGWTFFYGNLFWLNTTRLFNPIAPIAILLLGLYPALYLLPFSWLASRLNRNLPKLSLLILPAMWCFTEYFRSWGRLGFPWIYLGHSQWNWNLIIQYASITGVYGISFMIAFVNLLLAKTIYDFQQQKISKQKFTVSLICIPFFILIFSGIGLLLKPKSNKAEENPLRIALIQPNIDQVTKLQSYTTFGGITEAKMRLNYLKMKNANFDLSKQADIETSDLDLIVWPEAADTNPYFNHDKKSHNELKNWSSIFEASILMGSGYYEGGDDLEGDYYNSAYLIEPEKGMSKTIYHKMQLVPFGEHLPYFDKLPFVSKLVGILDFKEGKEIVLFDVKDKAKFGTLICFESAFANLARRNVKEGAEFLVVITNDAWYGLSNGPAQHQILSVFRAVENRRWVVRSANTGISCFINPSGKIVSTLELGKAGTISQYLSPETKKTIYTQFGDWFALLCIIISIFGILLDWKNRKRNDLVSD